MINFPPFFLTHSLLIRYSLFLIGLFLFVLGARRMHTTHEPRACVSVCRLNKMNAVFRRRDKTATATKREKEREGAHGKDDSNACYRKYFQNPKNYVIAIGPKHAKDHGIQIATQAPIVPRTCPR